MAAIGLCFSPLIWPPAFLFFLTMTGDNGVSLLAAAEAAPMQLELVPSTDLPAAFFDGEIVRGDFTAARLFSQHPDKYRAVISLVAEGFGVRSIARGLRISHNTIRAVCIREGVALDTARESVAKDYKLIERLLMERMIDCVDQIKPEALPMALGIVRDKINALEGNPTTIVGHVQTQAPIEDWNKYIDSLPGAEVIELQNGVRGGNVSAMGGMDGGKSGSDGDGDGVLGGDK